MVVREVMTKRNPPTFHRKSLRCESSNPTPKTLFDDFRVLVVNSSEEMAKEITLQLTASLPGCSITFAPSMSLALWIVNRRPLDLIVSSAVLPDGSVSSLSDALSELESAPDLMVVGSIQVQTAEALGASGYQFSGLKKFGERKLDRQKNLPLNPKALKRRIKDLGADIRNDLNNPLQELVAMVFIAQSAGEASDGTVLALDAINNVAKNISTYVNKLEDKIASRISIFP